MPEVMHAFAFVPLSLSLAPAAVTAHPLVVLGTLEPLTAFVLAFISVVVLLQLLLKPFAI